MTHIALVEDSPVLIRFLNDLLVKRSYRVSIYTSSQQAFAEMKKHQPDLAIIDLDFPDMSSLDLVKKIRADLSLQEVQVLVLTSQNDLDTRLKGLENADDFLGKPFDVNELLARIAALLRRRDSHTIRGRLELVGGCAIALQMMLVSHKKGALFLDDGAALYLKSGQIVHVVHPKETKEKAVRQILKRQRGNFRFRPDTLPPKESLNISPVSFMLELAKDTDEGAEERRQSITTQVQETKKQLVTLPNLAIAQTYMNSLQLQGLQNFTATEKYLNSYEATCVVFESDSIMVIALNSTLSMLPKDLLEQVKIEVNQNSLEINQNSVDVKEDQCSSGTIKESKPSSDLQLDFFDKLLQADNQQNKNEEDIENLLCID